jgi:hypothetical protein
VLGARLTNPKYGLSFPMITRLTRRFERRPLAKPNLVYFLWRFAANGMRAYRALATPVSYSDTPSIAQELTEQGIVVGPSDRFLGDEGRRALSRAVHKILDASRSDAVKAIVAGLARANRKKDFRIDLISHGISAESPLLKAALDQKLLEIVAAYLGLWPSLHSIGGWLNYPTTAPAPSSQLWHHDPEDLKIIKVFIYLADVNEENGPFTYIPGTHPFGANVAEAEKYGKQERLVDDQIGGVFSPHLWRVCTGPANTMILADTLGYHRGGKPSAGTRILVTFTYTSGTPLVEPSIWLKGTPDWISSDIQRWAVKQLGTAPPIKAAKKQPGLRITSWRTRSARDRLRE